MPTVLPVVFKYSNITPYDLEPEVDGIEPTPLPKDVFEDAFELPSEISGGLAARTYRRGRQDLLLSDKDHLELNEPKLEVLISQSRLKSVFSVKEVDLLASGDFLDVVKTDRFACSQLQKLIGNVPTKKAVKEFIAQNPLMSLRERHLLLAAMAPYEAFLAKRAAIDRSDGPEKKWTQFKLTMARLLGFSPPDDELIQVLCVDMYRDRFSPAQTARIEDDSSAALKVLIATGKNHRSMKEAAAKRGADDLRNLEKSQLAADDRVALLAKNNVLLQDTRTMLAHVSIPKLLGSDFGEKLSITQKSDKLARLRGLYAGHYLTDDERGFLHQYAGSDRHIEQIINKKVWDAIDRLVIRGMIKEQLANDPDDDSRLALTKALLHLYAP